MATQQTTVPNMSFGMTTGVRRRDVPSAIPAFANQTPIPKFNMRGRDVDVTIQPAFVYWTANGVQDWTGAQYGGPKAGASPLADIVEIPR